MDYQTCLEQIFKQFQFLWFSIKRGHCCCKGFGQFRDYTDVIVETGWIAVRRQLVKGQQKLVCFNYRRGILTAKLWLTRGARFPLFPWRSTRGAVGNFFLSFCRHVRVLTNFFWPSCHHVRVFFCLWLFKWPEIGEEYPTSGQRSSEERSPVVSPFSELLLLDVPGTATEQVRTFGFRRNSSSFDKAPKIRDSVLLNSFESFLVGLSSNFSETWEM